MHYSSCSSMFAYRDFLASLGTAVVLCLSSVPFVRLSDYMVSLKDQEFCSQQHMDRSSCTSDHEHNCIWCDAKAVKSACYDADFAKKLPHSVFTCTSTIAEVEVVTE
jgi:hypothetical protein